MTGQGDELEAIFRDEAAERLDEMDAALVAVESGNAGAESIDALFRNAHTIKGAAGMLGLDDIRTLAHAMEDIMAEVRDAGVFPPRLAAPLLRATGTLRALVEGTPEPIDGVLGELAAGRAAGPGEAGEVVLAAEVTGPATRESAPTKAGGAEAGRIETRAAEPGAPQEVPAAHQSASSVRRPAAARGSLRVPAEKIDHLLDMVGEVMQDRRRLAHSLGAREGVPQEVADVLSAGDRLLDELKDTAVGMRTIPLSAITGPLPRAVRDIARAAGKDVEFVVTGADTELDRVIVESMSEPLTHLLRNSIDHGIEPPAERERAGKPPRGRVELRAVPRGSLVEIVVTDDGRGISPEIAQQAHREGSLTDLLSQPGYSTAAAVTDLAGRGVGLDAVKSYVQSLGGAMEIRSEPGGGMNVVLILPLALALLEVLLFERAGSVYGVPLAVVEEVVLIGEPLMLEGRPALEVHGRSLPATDVAELTGAQAPRLADRPPGVVVSAGGRHAIITCDRILGQEEVVVKPLGPIFADIQRYLGAAILGDGRIALLIEPAMLTHKLGRAAPASRPSPEAASGVPAAAKVLVVEDSFTVRELQRSILEAAGYTVATARDGREALAALDRDAQIALVVTDLEMPELDGLALTRAIRADPRRSSLPVVIVTSHGSDDDRRQGIEAGADAYMVKSAFDQQALLTTVERLVGR